MERREFLRQAAVGAAGLMLTEAEKEIVDPRLMQKVTIAANTALVGDLIADLRKQTGVPIDVDPIASFDETVR